VDSLLTSFSNCCVKVVESISTSSTNVFKLLLIVLAKDIVLSASFLISSATTANPTPTFPALAASIDAFSASIFI